MLISPASRLSSVVVVEFCESGVLLHTLFKLIPDISDNEMSTAIVVAAVRCCALLIE